MSFQQILNSFNFQNALRIVSSASEEQVFGILNKEALSLNDFLVLLSDTARRNIESLAQKSNQLTKKHFGKTIQLYAPLYLSNECDNQCVYCGFNNRVSGKRISLSIDQAIAEAKILSRMGFKHILLVSGEKPDVISLEYLEKLTPRLKEIFPSVSLEIYPMEVFEYQRLFRAGADGLTIYQEVYDPLNYKKFHPLGPKADYNFRLAAPERGGAAGFYKLNIGCLLGLGDWLTETIALGLHAEYLQKKFWQSQISISFPRLLGYKPLYPVTDQQFVQMITALRIFLPKAGLVLSTRESEKMRDALIPLGITQMSAASRTSPGAYSGIFEAARQFNISDQRSLSQISELIKSRGYEPVFKDWDKSLDML